jgi:hypothetical protein
VVIPVTASVDDDGLVQIEGDDLSLVRWNHRPALVRAALERFGGRADWKPRWYLLAVPTEAFVGSARSVFSLAALDKRRDCRVTRTTNPEHLTSRAPAPTMFPPLRIATQYLGPPQHTGTSREVRTTTNGGAVRLFAPLGFSEDRCVGRLTAVNRRRTT